MKHGVRLLKGALFFLKKILLIQMTSLYLQPENASMMKNFNLNTGWWHYLSLFGRK
jgi:hypothetical protein